jgi:hypothetical protein
MHPPGSHGVVAAVVLVACSFTIPIRAGGWDLILRWAAVRNFVYPSSSGFDSLGFLFHCLFNVRSCPALSQSVLSHLPVRSSRRRTHGHHLRSAGVGGSVLCLVKKMLIRHFAGNIFNRPPPRSAHRPDWSWIFPTLPLHNNSVLFRMWHNHRWQHCASLLQQVDCPV